MLLARNRGPVSPAVDVILLPKVRLAVALWVTFFAGAVACTVAPTMRIKGQVEVAAVALERLVRRCSRSQVELESCWV